MRGPTCAGEICAETGLLRAQQWPLRMCSHLPLFSGKEGNNYWESSCSTTSPAAVDWHSVCCRMHDATNKMQNAECLGSTCEACMHDVQAMMATVTTARVSTGSWSRGGCASPPWLWQAPLAPSPPQGVGSDRGLERWPLWNATPYKYTFKLCGRG